MSRPRAYSYVRMSTDLQLQGDSLRRQIELSKKYAQEHDLDLVDDFQLHDIGISAYKGANVEKGELGQFLQAVEEGKIPQGSYLLVESLDRLSRQRVTVSVSLLFRITQSGINLVTLADGQLYPAGNETDYTKLIYSIVVMARANEESEMKSSRIAAAWKNKRANLDNQILTKWCPAWLEVLEDRSGFRVLEERKEIVQRIFLAAESGQGSAVITRILNHEQVPPFGRSHGWIESYVTKILKNRAVLGEFQPHVRVDGKRISDGPLVKDYYPRIIEEELFLKVQAGRRNRSQNGGGRRGPKQRNLFTHLVKCGYCGSSMRFVDKGKGPKGGQYLRCSASVRGMDCVDTSWRYTDFEASFFAFVREFDLKAVIEDTHKKSEVALIEDAISVQRERIHNKEAERDRVYDLLVAADDASLDFLKGRLALVSNEIQTLETEITALHDKTKISGGLIGTPRADDQLMALKNLSSEADFAQRLMVSNRLRRLIHQIQMLPQGKRPLFQDAKALAERKGGSKKQLESLLGRLEASYLLGDYSNPLFTIIFANGEVRTIVPNPKEPTTLLAQDDFNDAGVWRTNASGQTDLVVAPKFKNNARLKGTEG